MNGARSRHPLDLDVARRASPVRQPDVRHLNHRPPQPSDVFDHDRI